MENAGKLTNESQSNQQATRRLVNRLIEMSDYEHEPEIQAVELSVGEILFEQDAVGNSMYVLKAGVLGVRIALAAGGESDIARLAPGAVVGEMALLSGDKRSATVYAVNNCGLVRVSKERFLQLIDEDQQALVAMSATAAPRWQRDQLFKVLASLLGTVDAMALDLIEEQLQWLYYANGDVVFRQGDAPDGLYIVINGRLRVTLSTNGAERDLGEISPGEMVGEMAVLTDKPRSATVHAVRASNLVRISPAGFRQLTRHYPELMTTIARVIVERKQQAMRGAPGPSLCSLNIAVIPASPEVDAAAFAQELGRSIAKFDTFLVLDAAQFDARYGQEGAAQAEANDPRNPTIAAWMNELDFKQSTILYVADPEPSPWTRRCIGQSDRVLIVADPAADPAPGAVEQLVAQLDVPLRGDLALWHAPGTERPRRTAAWLDARQVRAHYHVRQEDEAHMDRLARRLKGRAVALVCSGGAARAYAEMGTYKAMLDLDIPVDFVSGTSMGAIMAGGIALELSYAEMEKLADWVADYGVADYTLPLASLTSSDHVTRICKKIFGDQAIEDLWIPFFCVSTNLSLAEPVYHQQGPMWRAVRASMSIPGVYLPLTENEEVLVDGGAMDNFPVATTIALCETEHVIGVHVSPYKEHKRQYDYDTNLSGWRILLSRLNPFEKPLRTPAFLDTMMRSVEVGGVRQGKVDEDLVELLIRPDVSGFKPTAYAAYKKLAQIGYDAALEPLREWKQQYAPD